MLTCRSLFFRIDRVVGFTSRCLKSKQERFSIMSFKGNAAMDGGSKKEKMVNLVWRPISTRSSSVVYSEAAEGQCSKPSGVSERAPVVSAGKHSVSLEVGASLMKFIKGKEGTTQMKIEDEMGVKIIFPSSRNEDHIIIEGGSVDCVTKASERIATIVDEVVKSPSLDYSHFVSLPLAIHPELVAKLVNFQNSILGNQSIAGDKQDVQSSTLFDLGIEKSIFIKPSTFHLTVLMLKLWKKDRFNTARDVLKSGASRMIEFRDIGMLHSIVPGTLVGENIYWHVYDAKVKVTDKFLGFDLVSETFKFYPGPSNCVKGFPEVIAGGLRRGGGLCTVGVDALSGGLIVWSAQHDDKIGGGIKSWSKICILSPGILEISTSCRIHRIFVVSAITYAGLLLVLVDIDGKESMKRESKLLAYNLEEKSLTNVDTSLSLYSCGRLLTYVETLVPIPGRLNL